MSQLVAAIIFSLFTQLVFAKLPCHELLQKLVQSDFDRSIERIYELLPKDEQIEFQKLLKLKLPKNRSGQTVAKVIDRLTTMNFTPPRYITVLASRPSTFIDDNTELIFQKIMLQFYTMQPATRDPISYLVRDLLLFLSPFNYSQIKGSRLTFTHLRILESGGPFALYQFIKRHDGSVLAARYWFKQIKNGVALTTILGGAIALPKLISSYLYISSGASITTDSSNEKIIKMMGMTPEEFLRELKKENKSIDIDQLMAAIERELNQDSRGETVLAQ